MVVLAIFALQTFIMLRIVCLLLLLPCISFGQDEPIEIKALTEKIDFDGQLNESFWPEMTSFSTVQHLPFNGEKPSEGEAIYLTYDKDYLYLAAKIEGQNIQAPSKKRDEFSLRPDWLGIILDGYNDDENGLGFFTTPSATRTDFTVFEDAVGEFPVNLDWNTYWDVKTKRFDDHWTVEMRIPFSSLQFQENNGIAEMGLIVWRAIASKNETDTWPLIANEWGDWSNFKPSMARQIRLRNIKSSKPIYVTPYALAGLDRVVTSQSPFEAETGTQMAVGADVKYNVTSNLTLDLSVNTDFAQVEVDDAQVNLDRFSLFFPEKRQFFQERAAIFDLRVGGPNRIFYSRRIGIDDDGNLEKIMGGARLTGRIGNYDIGVINMATRHDNWSLKNNFSIIRARKKVLNANSYIGIIGTNKTNFKGENNSVYALDGTFRLRGNHLLQMRWAQSFTNGFENNPLSLKPTRFILNLEKVQFNGFNYDLAIGRRGEDYNPELGFENRTNFTSIFAILGYGWQSKPESKILQQSFRMFNFSFLNNDSMLDETSNMGLQYRVEWKSRFSYYIFSYLRRERLFESVSLLDDFIIQDGLYNINVWGTGFGTPSARALSYNLNLRAGDLFSSKFFQIENNIEWVVFQDLGVGLFYNYNPIFKNGWTSDEIIHVHLARLKFLYTLSTKLSLSGFLQATSDGNVGLGNIRFRYNPREGVDLFLVYNNVTELDRLFIQQEIQQSIPEQVLIAKLTYTFRI